jgi:predicted MFS family arabinose efflux permease
MSRLALLRDPSLARVFAARSVSAFGTAMTPVALPFAVLQDLQGTPREVGLVVAAGSAAQILVQLFGGAFADRGSRQRQVVGADALAAAAQALLALLLLTGEASLPGLIAIQVVVGASFGLHWPAAVGLVPLVVPRESLQPANALLSIANATAIGVGAAAGGFLAARFGAGTAIAVDALSFAASALLVAGVRARPQVRSAAASLWRELRAGWREFTSHRWLWTIVLQFTVMTTGWFGAFAVVGPIVAQRSLGGADAWGVIAASFGFGLVTGGLVALRVHFPRPMLAATLTCFPGALVPLLLVAPAPLAWIAAGAFVAGVGMEIFSVLWNTALHTHVEPSALSRVSAYDAVGSIALVPLGEVLAGLSVESIGAPSTLLWAAAAILVPTALVLGVPEVRQLRSAPSVP